MNNKFLVGFNGLLIIALGELLTGTAINDISLKAKYGLFLILIGVYISGYFLAMRK